jgi:hypothetical protein
VNFALKAEVARTFLDSKGISYQSAHSDVQLPPADVGDIARPFTVEIECYANPQTNEHVQVDQTTARVVLYEEDLNDPLGKRYIGSATWRTEMLPSGPSLASEIGVRADVEIPERQMKMTFSLGRNIDKLLPASHDAEIKFNLPVDFPGGGISNIPGILIKDSEQARGTPLKGLAAKVADGFFLIGLSAVDSDVQSNIDLLKNRGWFDIPIIYTNGGRAILAVEKGQPGERAFAAAFAVWKESPLPPPPSANIPTAPPSSAPPRTPALPRAPAPQYAYYEVVGDLHLRAGPAPSALDILGYLIPQGSQVYGLASENCLFWNGSGRGSLDADNLWCPIFYLDRDAVAPIKGWANALYLKRLSDGKLQACVSAWRNGCPR